MRDNNDNYYIFDGKHIKDYNVALLQRRLVDNHGFRFDNQRSGTGRVFYTHRVYSDIKLEYRISGSNLVLTDYPKIVKACEEVAKKEAAQDNPDPVRLQLPKGELRDNFRGSMQGTTLILQLKEYPEFEAKVDVPDGKPNETIYREAADSLKNAYQDPLKTIDELKEKYSFTIRSDEDAIYFDQDDFDIHENFPRKEKKAHDLIEVIDDIRKKADKIRDERYDRLESLSDKGFKVIENKEESSFRVTHPATPKAAWTISYRLPDYMLLDRKAMEIVADLEVMNLPEPLEAVSVSVQANNAPQSDAMDVFIQANHVRELPAAPSVPPKVDSDARRVLPKTDEYTPAAANSVAAPLTVPKDPVISAGAEEDASAKPAVAFREGVREVSRVAEPTTPEPEVGALNNSASVETPRDNPVYPATAFEKSFGYLVVRLRNERQWTENKFADLVKQELESRKVLPVTEDIITAIEENKAAPRSPAEMQAMTTLLITENPKITDKEAAITGYQDAFYDLKTWLDNNDGSTQPPREFGTLTRRYREQCRRWPDEFAQDITKEVEKSASVNPININLQYVAEVQAERRIPSEDFVLASIEVFNRGQDANGASLPLLGDDRNNYIQAYQDLVDLGVATIATPTAVKAETAPASNVKTKPVKPEVVLVPQFKSQEHFLEDIKTQRRRLGQIFGDGGRPYSKFHILLQRAGSTLSLNSSQLTNIFGENADGVHPITTELRESIKTELPIVLQIMGKRDRTSEFHKTIDALYKAMDGFYEAVERNRNAPQRAAAGSGQTSASKVGARGGPSA